MTIRERLKTIGQAFSTDKVARLTESQAEELVTEAIEKATPGATATFFDLATRPLSDETKASNKLLQANKEWVFRNNDVIAKEVSTLEFQLFTSKMVGGELELTPITSHPLLDLLDRFNEAESRQDGLYNTSSHKTLVGDSFWLLDGNVNDPANIYLLNPTKTEVLLGDFTQQASRMIVGYKFKTLIKGKPIERRYDPEEIIHFKSPNPSNPVRGVGKVEALAGTIDLDNLTTEVNKEFFNRGAITNFVLTTDQKIGEENKQRLRAELKASYGGYKNAYKVMLLSGGIKPNSIQMSNKDMEFLQQLEWYRDKITSVFGNTKSVLGITDDVNRANAESTIAQWKQSTVRPEMSAITNTLNEFLVPRYGDNLILGFKDPVPENREEKRREAIELYNAGIITKNEARGIVEYEQAEGGDDFRDTITFNPLDPNDVPKSLRHIDLAKILRRTGFSRQQTVYKTVYPEALQLAKKHYANKDKETKPITSHFSDRDVIEFYGKLMRIVDVLEERFENATIQLINAMVEEASANLDNEDARANNQLVDQEAFEANAVAKLQPILFQAAIAGGQEGNRLIGIDDPYIPKTYTKASEGMVEFIRKNILKFAASIGATNVDIITSILADGIANELSIAEIRRKVQAKFFGSGKQAKRQAETITRTEVIKTTNAGTQDAYQQSGVVAAKQWLSELDHRTSDICIELDGKIVDIDKDFVEKGGVVAGVSLDYDDTPYPPAHPNCRSTIIPVLLEAKSDGRQLRDQIERLEKQIDKRTKAYRDLQQKHHSLTDYKNELEIITGVVDEKS